MVSELSIDDWERLVGLALYTPLACVGPVTPFRKGSYRVGSGVFVTSGIVLDPSIRVELPTQRILWAASDDAMLYMFYKRRESREKARERLFPPPPPELVPSLEFRHVVQSERARCASPPMETAECDIGGGGHFRYRKLMSEGRTFYFLDLDSTPEEQAIAIAWRLQADSAAG